MYNIINVPLQKLKAYENNPRNNTLAVDKVKASIQRVGFMFPIVIDMNYVIVCGHTRHLACLALGQKTIPCIMVDDLDQDQIDLFRFVDNKSSEYASWDYEKLADELRMIDMSLEPNEVMMKSFDFDLSAAEFEVVPASVPVATFNFMGDNYKKDAAKQAAKEEPEEQDDEDADYSGDVDTSEAGWVEGLGDSELRTSENKSSDGGDVAVFGEEKKSAPSVIHVFRCGSHRFIISEREEERLIEAYTKYMGTVYPSTTFIKYLLGGADNDEVQV